MDKASEDERKQAMRRKIEHQVQCEERAFRIVEKLIENPVDEKYFLESVLYLAPNHYQDIVEERAISKLCGYPLCWNPLGQVLRQKYVISTKTNKIYDIEERKNFCSGKCFKASKHVEKQISTAPVWSRKSQQSPSVKLLPLDIEKGLVGDEVLVSNRDEVTRQVEKLTRLDHYQDMLQQGLHGNENHHHGNQNDDLEDEDEGESEGTVYTLEKALDEMDLSSDDRRPDQSVRNTGSQGDRGRTVEGSVAKVKGQKGHAGRSDKVNLTEMSDTRVGDASNTDAPQQKTEVRDTESKKMPEVKKGERKKKQKGIQKTTSDNTGMSKTEYLMKLLDKKKSLLSKMADIQNEPVKECPSAERTTVAQPAQSENNSESSTSTNQVASSNDSKTVGNSSSANNSGQTGSSVESSRTVEVVDVATGEDVKQKQIQCTSTSGISLPRKPTTLELIFQGVKSWMTVKSLEYITTLEDSKPVLKPSDYEEKYQSLVKAVDVQERQFDNMLGEVSLDDESDSAPSGHLPHFDVLKAETEDNVVKVQEFFKGSFTYRKDQKLILEKSGKKDETEIVLPTVDRYDQMLIRQRIVLDRISTVLPELLSPLQLLVQDIYTELKLLVVTFNLSAQNILFKPAEWILVTLIILKLLSRKMQQLEDSFKHPSAIVYLGTLLKGLEKSPEELELLVDQLLQSK